MDTLIATVTILRAHAGWTLRRPREVGLRVLAGGKWCSHRWCALAHVANDTERSSAHKGAAEFIHNYSRFMYKAGELSH